MTPHIRELLGSRGENSKRGKEQPNNPVTGYPSCLRQFFAPGREARDVFDAFVGAACFCVAKSWNAPRPALPRGLHRWFLRALSTDCFPRVRQLWPACTSAPNAAITMHVIVRECANFVSSREKKTQQLLEN